MILNIFLDEFQVFDAVIAVLFNFMTNIKLVTVYRRFVSQIQTCCRFVIGFKIPSALIRSI